MKLELPSVSNIQVRYVEFANTQPILRDRLTNGSATEYAPIWLDEDGDGSATNWAAGDVRGPICYVVDTPVTIQIAVFAASQPPPAGAVMYGREQGAIGDSFVSNQLQYNDGKIFATFGTTGSTSSTIAAVKDVTIDWRLEVPTQVPISAGSTRNPLYWVLAPLPGGTYASYYSCVDIGCTRAAGLNGSNHKAIADAIFAEFSDRSVVRSTDVLEGVTHPEILKYWHSWWNASPTLAPLGSEPGLLDSGDGRCEAWCQFFIGCLHAVGIDPVDEYVTVTPEPVLNDLALLLVPTWSAVSKSNEDGHLGWQYPYINIPGLIWGVVHEFVGPMWYTFWMEDFVDEAGVSGQGPVMNPASMWGNHAMVRVGENNYYDPSYGNTHNSHSSIDSIFFAFARGYGIRNMPTIAVDEGAINYVLNGGGITPGNWVETPAIIFKMNSLLLDTRLDHTNVSR